MIDFFRVGVIGYATAPFMPIGVSNITDENLILSRLFPNIPQIKTVDNVSYQHLTTKQAKNRPLTP